MGERICMVSTCQRKVRCRDLCNSHYSRFIRTGVVESQTPTQSERFWSRVDAFGVCWEWTAGTNHAGYGVFGYSNGSLAHRYAYEALVGPIPEGLVIDHLCRNPPCVNPDHLEPVTLVENIRRGVAGKVLAARARAKTHCPAGHEYSEQNTYVAPRTGSRRCKKCHSKRVTEANRKARNAIK